MFSPKLLSLKEILILVLILTILATIIYFLFGPALGKNLSYGAIITVTVLAIINKNISLKDKIFRKKENPVN